MAESHVSDSGLSEVAGRATPTLTPIVAALMHQRELKLQKEKSLEIQTNPGSAYPPMSIAPFPRERERLSGSSGNGMTAEERAMRRKWVHAQTLAPNEPRFEVLPKNIFRRTLAMPFDVIGLNRFPTLRYAVRTVVMAFLGVNIIYYHVVLKEKTWENGRHGWLSFCAFKKSYEEGAIAPLPKYPSPAGSPLV